MVHTESMTDSLRELWLKRWPSFTPEELLSPDGLAYFRRGFMVMQLHFMDKLQQFRNQVNLPFLINHQGLTLRGWRSPAENATIDGKLYHPMGLAADISIKDMSPQELAEHAIDFGFHGIGLYSTWVHVDLRPVLDKNQVVWGFLEER